MSDPHPARTFHEKEDRRTFLQKIAEFIHPGPDSRAELIETLADAEDNDIIGAESRVMLEEILTAGYWIEITGDPVWTRDNDPDLFVPHLAHEGPRHERRERQVVDADRALRIRLHRPAP